MHPSEGRAREWMTAEPVTVPRGTSLDEAALVMSGHGFHHLPVVGDDDDLLGVVGLRDTVRAGALAASRSASGCSRRRLR